MKKGLYSICSKLCSIGKIELDEWTVLINSISLNARFFREFQFLHGPTMFKYLCSINLYYYKYYHIILWLEYKLYHGPTLLFIVKTRYAHCIVYIVTIDQYYGWKLQYSHNINILSYHIWVLRGSIKM